MWSLMCPSSGSFLLLRFGFLGAWLSLLLTCTPDFDAIIVKWGLRAHEVHCTQTRFCNSLVARDLICSTREGTRPLVFACFHSEVAGCITMSPFATWQTQTQFPFWISVFLPHFCMIIYHSVEKNTLAENIYLICWPIDLCSTLFGPCDSVPLWRVCKYRFSQHGLGRTVLG